MDPSDASARRRPRPGRRPLILGLALAAAISITAPQPPAAVASDMTIGWINECRFSHRSKDDPIVYPRQPGAAHHHDFYGNRSTDAFSRYRTLVRARTTCDLRADRAAYWIPSVLAGGRMVEPIDVRFYYRSVIDPPRVVRPFPRGLKVIAGHPHATRKQDTDVAWWQCDRGPHTAMPKTCDAGERVVFHVQFPECWDGERLDSVDHMRHMRYSIDLDDGRDVCPRSHPIAVPRLIVRYGWPVRDGTRITLSSGPAYTLHADFINSWVQDRLRRLVRRCIQAARDCGTPGDR
jgi:hypothetical protein